MMQARCALVALMGLAGCVAGGSATQPTAVVLDVQPTLPPGYPPKIGMFATKLNERAEIFETHDYSIGAFDASVQVYDFNGEIRFTLMAEQAGRPQGKDARAVFVRAVMRNTTQTGDLTDAVVEIITNKDFDGPRLTSVGSGATVALTSLTAMGPQGEYGHVTGTVSAQLCAATGQPAVIDRTKCQPFSGSFDSDLQISGR